MARPDMIDASRAAGAAAGKTGRKWIKGKVVPETTMQEPPVGSASGTPGATVGDGGKKRSVSRARAAMYGEK